MATRVAVYSGTSLALRVFLPFAAGYFLSFMFRTVNAVIAPLLVAETGLSASGLGFLTSAFFLSFAAAQLPLGLLLDRFGPRRVEALLLASAALGSALFAIAGGPVGLTVARALIGLGVSACMMAGFKAFVLWFPPHRLPFVNGCLLAVGGLGAITATAPVEVLVGAVGWRVLFWGLAAAVVVLSLALLAVVPERGSGGTPGLRAQLGGMAAVFRDRYFWRLAPATVCAQAAFLSLQSLWAGPWMRDVGGLDRAAVGTHLMALAGAVVAGFVVSGAVAERLSRRGIRAGTVAVGAMVLFVLVQCLIVVAGPLLPGALWMAFGLFGSATTVAYAGLSQHFHGALAGRANTALNVLVFVAAFGVQWGVGVVLDAWEDPVTNTYGAAGYHWAFGILILLQVATIGRYAALAARVRDGGH